MKQRALSWELTAGVVPDIAFSEAVAAAALLREHFDHEASGQWCGGNEGSDDVGEYLHVC